MPLFLCEPDAFAAWAKIFGQVISMQVPTPDDEDRDEWPRRPAWKVKKWTALVVYQLFDRYGISSHCDDDHRPFAEHYTQNYSLGVLQLIWQQVQAYSAGEYLAPRVATIYLRYLETA